MEINEKAKKQVPKHNPLKQGLKPYKTTRVTGKGQSSKA